jgi:hypothetical protein
MRKVLVPSLLAVAVVAALAGCSSIKRATGQLDDTVLPGERENVLPPEQQTARDPNLGGKSMPDDSLSGDTLQDNSLQSEQPECLPDEPNCISQAPVKPRKGSATIQ